MLLAALVIALVAIVPTPPPSPSPTPLREIGRVRSGAFCSTFHGEVAALFFALLRGDTIIAAGQEGLKKMADDDRDGGRGDPAAIERPYLERVVAALKLNFGVIDALLADAEPFVRPSVSEDLAALAKLKDELQIVRSGQTAAFNILNGTLENESFQSIRGDLPFALPTYGSATSFRPARAPRSAFSDNMLGAPGEVIDPHTVMATMLRGQTFYDHISQGLKREQQRVASDEETLSKTVLEVAPSCR